jgi:hypothetical protein
MHFLEADAERGGDLRANGATMLRNAGAPTTALHDW